MAKRDSKKSRIIVDRIQGDPDELPEGMVHRTPRGPDAPPRLSQEIEISEDPDWIAWTRQAYEADLDERFTEALRKARSGEQVYLDFRQALEERRPQAVEELRKIMDNRRLPAKARARAAEVLNSLGQPDGATFLQTALESSKTEMSAAALEMLNDLHNTIDLTQPEIARRIVRLLSSSDADVVKKAARLCAWRKVPGAEEGLRAALAAGGEPVEALAEALARLATTPESIQAALPYLFHKRQKEYTPPVRFRFESVLKHGDPAVAQPLRQALRRYLLSYKKDRDPLGQHWVGDFAAVAETDDTAVLEDILTRAKDPVSRAYALGALARLQPERAVERVLVEIQNHRPWDMLVRLLRKYAIEKDYPRICRVLYPKSGQKRQLQLEEARLLLENLGQRGREQLRRDLNRLEPSAREWATWKLQGLNVRSALTELHAAGVIHQTPDELLNRARPEEDEDEPPDESHPWLLLRALSWSGLTKHFDTETGFVPCNHHHVIREFSQRSGGQFALECPVQIWHRKDEDDYDAPYTVQFLYRGRLYRFAAENYGDYYDVEAVVRALNTALEHNGQKERYIGLHTGDQCAHFIFADPAAFVPIAEKYGVPLARDASEGMRAGRAFEQQVFESLNE